MILLQLGRAKIKWYSENNHFKDMNRIGGMPTEFEWNIFPGITTLGLLEKIQDLMKDLQCVNVQRHCMGRKKEIQKDVNTIHRQVRNMLVDSRAVIGLSWGLDQKRKGTEPAPTNSTDPARQYFFSLDTEEGLQMQHLCREHTMLRTEKETRKRGWILKNTRIGPVLNVKVCYHDDRNSIEVQIPSLFEDNTASWVRIVTGVDKYVTESMLTKKEEDIASEKPVAKARPRQKPTVTLASVSIPVLERKGSTLKHNDHTITSVMKCQKP